MEDILLLAYFQSLADINAHFHDVVILHLVIHNVLEQGRQQFHADDNVPSHAVGMRDSVMIVITDNICVSLQSRHKAKFLCHTVHKSLEIGRRRRIIHTHSPY